MTMIAHSRAYLDVAGFLDGGFRGTYGQLGELTDLHPRAVGTLVRRYARLNPIWDHWRVVAKKTRRPAYA